MIVAVIAAMSLSMLDGDVATTASEPPAVTAPGTAAATADTPAVDPSKKICRKYIPTGSRLGGERICHTQAEWNQITNDARKATDDQVRHGMQFSMPPNTTGG